jgi:hypothetical protein
VKKFLILCLCCALALPLKASAYGGYGGENPFVEAMLRMMEIFGMIRRDRLPLAVPYLPGYGQQLHPGLGGYGQQFVPGLGGYAGVPGMGIGGFPGLSPIPGLGGVPGMSPMSGLGGVPGMGGIPGAGTWPGGGFPPAGGVPGTWLDPSRYGSGPMTRTSTHLNGIWELENAGFVIIQGNMARLYLSRERYQDFEVYYDRQHLWWRPQEGGAPSRYLYQAREGHMILQDEEGNLLLMRQRR